MMKNCGIRTSEASGASTEASPAAYTAPPVTVCRPRWPVGTLVLFLVALSASFMTWGVIEADFTGLDVHMITLHGAGPPPPNDIAGPGALPRRGNLWQSGLVVGAVRISCAYLMVFMGGLLAIEIRVQRTGAAGLRRLSYVLDALGIIMAGSAMISFLYQGTPGPGLLLVLGVFVCMGVFHGWQFGRIKNGVLTPDDMAPR